MNNHITTLFMLPSLQVTKTLTKLPLNIAPSLEMFEGISLNDDGVTYLYSLGSITLPVIPMLAEWGEITSAIFNNYKEVST